MVLLSESGEKRFRFANDLEALELKTENWIITFGLILLQNVMILNSVGVKRKIDPSTNYNEEDQLAIILIMVLLSK